MNHDIFLEKYDESCFFCSLGVALIASSSCMLWMWAASLTCFSRVLSINSVPFILWSGSMCTNPKTSPLMQR